jgi:hypothetical protein
VDALISSYIHSSSAAAAECPSVATLMQTSDADSNGVLDATEVKTLVYELMPCLRPFTLAGSSPLTVEVDTKVRYCQWSVEASGTPRVTACQFGFCADIFRFHMHS